MCVQDEKDLPDYENSTLKDQYAVIISHLIAVCLGKVDQTHYEATDAQYFPLSSQYEENPTFTLCSPTQHHLIFSNCYLSQVNEPFVGTVLRSCLHILLKLPSD